jgi:hypothetical protein
VLTVVKTEAKDLNSVALDAIDDTVSICEPARPPALEVALEEFRLADALVRCATNLVEHAIELSKPVFVLG